MYEVRRLNVSVFNSGWIQVKAPNHVQKVWEKEKLFAYRKIIAHFSLTNAYTK